MLHKQFTWFFPIANGIGLEWCGSPVSQIEKDDDAQVEVSQIQIAISDYRNAGWKNRAIVPPGSPVLSPRTMRGERRERNKKGEKNWTCRGGSDGRRGRLYLTNKVAAKECTLLGRVDSGPLSVISTTRAAATSGQPGGRLSTSAVELGNDNRKRGRQRWRTSCWTLTTQSSRDPGAGRYNIARAVLPREIIALRSAAIECVVCASVIETSGENPGVIDRKRKEACDASPSLRGNFRSGSTALIFFLIVHENMFGQYPIITIWQI